MSNVFAQLPNDIIMRIIREADGGLSQHKINFKGVMSHFNSCVPVNFYPQVEQIIGRQILSNGILTGGV